MTRMRIKHTIRLPADLSVRLADYAARKKVSQALIVETALASFLSPDGPERLEAALARRLDRMTRQLERMERRVTIANESLAVVRGHREWNYWETGITWDQRGFSGTKSLGKPLG